MTLKIYRAESYAGLQEFKAAIDDLNAVLLELPNWPEVKLLFEHWHTCKNFTCREYAFSYGLSFSRIDWLTL